MATVRIYFYLDVKQTLATKAPGSLDKPTALAHSFLQLQWVDDGGNKSDVVSSDTHVPVPSQGTVEIYIVDYDSTVPGISPPRLEYSVAPVRFLAGTWTPQNGGSAQTCTTDFLKGLNSPMGGVNFEVMHNRYYDLAYKNTGDPGWVTDSSYFTTDSHWFPAGAACEVMDATPQSPVVLGPYINLTFNDLLGTLYYGLEMEIAVSGQGGMYYCWDPYIDVK